MLGEDVPAGLRWLYYFNFSVAMATEVGPDPTCCAQHVAHAGPGVRLLLPHWAVWRRVVPAVCARVCGPHARNHHGRALGV